MTGNNLLVAKVRKAKRELREAGCHGDTIEALVGDAVSRLRRLEADRLAVKEKLRAHGASPNGKRLPDAVDEALRLKARGVRTTGFRVQIMSTEEAAARLEAARASGCQVTEYPASPGPEGVGPR